MAAKKTKRRAAVFLLRSTALDATLGWWVFDGCYQMFWVPVASEGTSWPSRKAAAAARRRLRDEDGIKCEIVRFEAAS